MRPRIRGSWSQRSSYSAKPSRPTVSKVAIAKGRLNLASKIEVGAGLFTIHADMDARRTVTASTSSAAMWERLASEATASRPMEVAETARIPFEEVPLHHEVRAEGGHRGPDVGGRALRRRRDQAPFAFEHVRGPRIASPSQGGGQYAGDRRAAPVEVLHHHGFPADALPHAAGLGAGQPERGPEPPGIQTPDEAGRRGGPKAAGRAGRVPLVIVRGTEHPPHPGHDLVPRDNAAQELPCPAPRGLGNG